MYGIIVVIIVLRIGLLGSIIIFIIDNNFKDSRLFIIITLIFGINILIKMIYFVKQKNRDRAAKIVLKDLDYKKEKESILSVFGDIQKTFVCPYCKGLLKIKERGKIGIYEQFIGCENYPKCSFSKKL